MRTLFGFVQPFRRPSRRDARPTLARALSVLAILASLPGGNAAAFDQPITGRRLSLKSAPRVVLLSRDAGIDTSGFDPRCPSADSSLVLSDGVNSAAFPLPCTNWYASGSIFKYKNLLSPNGPSAVKLVRVKDGALKIIAEDLAGLSIPNGAGTINAVLGLDGIAQRLCMSFPGEGDGDRFLARNAPAASCPGASACAATTGGACWFLGVDDASCDAACAIEGRLYDSATETYAGSGGSDANCVAVLDDLGVPAGPLISTGDCVAGLGCLYAAGVARGRCVSPPTTSSAANGRRACACQ